MNIELENARLEADIQSTINQKLIDEKIDKLIRTNRIKMKLTPIENNIMQLICNGFSNSKIARIIVISENTVKCYLTNIYKKLNLKGDKTTKKLRAVLTYLGELDESMDSN